VALHPLNLAAIRGKVHVAKLLIRFGADLNPRTPLGSTPLYYSCTSRHYQLAALLLRSGADVHATAQRQAIHAAASCNGGPPGTSAELLSLLLW